jgi:hypothetical protein
MVSVRKKTHEQGYAGLNHSIEHLRRQIPMVTLAFSLALIVTDDEIDAGAVIDDGNGETNVESGSNDGGNEKKNRNRNRHSGPDESSNGRFSKSKVQLSKYLVSELQIYTLEIVTFWDLNVKVEIRSGSDVGNNNENEIQQQLSEVIEEEREEDQNDENNKNNDINGNIC